MRPAEMGNCGGGWAVSRKETSTKRILAALSLPNGVGRSDPLGCPANTVGSTLGRLKKLGLAYPAKTGHKTVRWFDTQARATAWLRTAPKPAYRAPVSERARFDPDAPMHYPRDAKGRPLWKETKAVTPPRALYSNTFSRY